MKVGIKLLKSRSCNDASQKYVEEQEYKNTWMQPFALVITVVSILQTAT
jgi:hypothetical protein